MSASDNSCSSSLYSYTKQCMFSVVSLSSGRHFAGQMILTFQERLRWAPKCSSSCIEVLSSNSFSYDLSLQAMPQVC